MAEEVYDDAGVVSQTNTVTWVYDNLGRLVEEYYDGEGTGHDFIDFYTYDLVGNRLQKQHDANPTFAGITSPSDLLTAVPPPNFSNGAGDYTTDYGYDDNDRLLTETKDAFTGSDERFTVYQYGTGDSATQQTGKTVHAGLSAAGVVKEQTDYTYNVQGRLSLVQIDSDADTNPDVDSTSEYHYNDGGFRISEKVNGVQTLFLVDGNNHTGYDQVLEAWDDLNINGMVDGVDTLSKSYVLGHDVIAQWAAANALYYLLYDGHGSTRGLVDALGQPLTAQVYAYDAYGNQLSGTGLATTSAVLTTLLYSGEQSDLATGMQYLRARFYDPRAGRFDRLDPFAGNLDDPLSLHKYLYVHADPITGVDPSGLMDAISVSVGTGLSSGLSAQIAAAAFAALEYTTAFLAAVTTAKMLTLTLPFVVDAVGAGVEGAGEILGKIAARTREIARAIEQVIVDAAATGLAIQQLRRLPLFPIIKSLGPDIYSFNVAELAKNPRWFLLTYNGPRNPQTDINRRWVNARYGNLTANAPANHTLDEFPYASTRQGGQFGPAVATTVPARQNAVQGGLLSAFYRLSLRGSPSSFLVVPLPF